MVPGQNYPLLCLCFGFVLPVSYIKMSVLPMLDGCFSASWIALRFYHGFHCFRALVMGEDGDCIYHVLIILVCYFRSTLFRFSFPLLFPLALPLRSQLLFWYLIACLFWFGAVLCLLLLRPALLCCTPFSCVGESSGVLLFLDFYVHFLDFYLSLEN